MSTILKALQRVEGEKGDGGPASGLREGVVARGERPSRDRPPLWKVGLMAAAVLLLLGFFVWRLLPDDLVDTPPAGSAPAIARERPPANAPGWERRTAQGPQKAAPGRARPAEPPPVSPGARPVTPQPPAARAEEAVPRARVAETPPRRAAAPPTAAGEAATPSVRAPAAPAAEVEEPEPWARIIEVPAPEVEPLPPAPELEAGAATSLPEPEVARAPPPEAAVAPPEAPARPRPVSASKPPAAPAETGRPPAVEVKRTIWHPTPERRLAQVEVEGREGSIQLHEGDVVGTLVVAEIKPSEVVFLHQGREIRRQVGGRR